MSSSVERHADPAPRDAILTLQGLTKDFRHNWTMRRLRVLDRLDLRVERGEIFGLIGPNGAGKTTTFKCLLGLLRPSAGSVLLDGRPLGVRERAAIGFLPEQPYFYDYLTVEETLRLYASLYGLHGRAARTRVAAVIERVRLGHKRRAALRSLSKGTMQRVGIAQAILNEPRLLILDEPMSGLDPTGRHAMRELVRELHAAGTTVIFSSHVLPDAEALCDRVAILVGGTLREIVDLRSARGAHLYQLTVSGVGADTVAALARLAGTPPTLDGGAWLLRLPASQDVGPALDLVRHAGGNIESLVPVHPSLEERFLAHAGQTRALD
ncbi:MAG: ABC transporter ATP-binding protein [Deltaproteobacteria bacterium]|nr:ABC transporter ATP-binding protein [Deltaproteobacteria bacterium]